MGVGVSYIYGDDLVNLMSQLRKLIMAKAVRVHTNSKGYTRLRGCVPFLALCGDTWLLSLLCFESKSCSVLWFV